MDKIKLALQNPMIKMSIIGIATGIKFYTPDAVDQMIDDALLIFLGYHAMGATLNNNG